jgi:hypothetical protein
VDPTGPRAEVPLHSGGSAWCPVAWTVSPHPTAGGVERHVAKQDILRVDCGTYHDIQDVCDVYRCRHRVCIAFAYCTDPNLVSLPQATRDISLCSRVQRTNALRGPAQRAARHAQARAPPQRRDGSARVPGYPPSQRDGG